MIACSIAHAHAGDAPAPWRLDLWVGLTLAVLTFVPARRRFTWWMGIATLFAALVWPLEALSQASFPAHMGQHLLLIAVAAPLLVAASVRAPSLRGLPAGGKRMLAAAGILWGSAAHPGRSFALHAAAVWAAHAPLAIAWMEASRAAHATGHAALLGTACLFWSALKRGGSRRAGHGALWALATLMHTGFLGALLTFAPRPLYAGHDIEAQQLAGLVMWIPGGLCYLIAGLLFVAVWLGREPGDAPLPASGPTT